MNRELRNIKLIDFIPQYLKENKDILGLCEGIEVELKNLFIDSYKLNLQERLSKGELTEVEVEDLMWEHHVDYFDTQLTLEKKIELIKNSLNSHLKKGTRASIEKQLSLVLEDYELLEWFEFEGDPYTFKVIAENSMPAPDKVEKAFKIINENKNVRSHCLGFIVSSTINLYLKYYSTIFSCGIDEERFKKSDFLELNPQKIKHKESYFNESLDNFDKLIYDEMLFMFKKLYNKQFLITKGTDYLINIEDLTVNTDVYRIKNIADNIGHEEYKFSEKMSFDNMFISPKICDIRHDIYNHEEENI